MHGYIQDFAVKVTVLLRTSRPELSRNLAPTFYSNMYMYFKCNSTCKPNCDCPIPRTHLLNFLSQNSQLYLERPTWISAWEDSVASETNRSPHTEQRKGWKIRAIHYLTKCSSGLYRFGGNKLQFYVQCCWIKNSK